MFNFSSEAASYTWSGSGGTNDWNTNANWTPNTGYPVDGDNVTIIKSGSPITISIPNTITTLVNFTTSNISLTFNSNISLTGTVSFASTTFSPTGTLSISNSSTITVTGSTFNIDLTIVNTSSSLISIGSSTTFNGAFDLTGNNFSLISCAFKSTTNILKKGTSFVQASACHDNLFDGITSISHEEGGVFFFGSDNDIFNKAVTIENKSGAQVIAIGYSSSYSATTYFHGDAEFKNSSNSIFYVSNPNTSHLEFSPLSGVDSIEVYFKNNGNSYLYIGNQGGIDFKQTKVHVSSTVVPTPSTPAYGTMQMGLGLASPTANRIKFDPNSNLYTSDLNASFGLSGVEFQGQYTPGITITPDTLRFLGNAYTFIIDKYCRFDRDLKIDLLSLNSLFGIYNGTVKIIQKSKDCTIGSNQNDALFFYNDVTFIHKYPTTGGSWNIFGASTGSSSYATFNSTASHRSVITLRSESPSYMWFGYLTGNLNLNSVDVIIDRQVNNNFVIGSQMNVNFNNCKVYIKQSVNTSLFFGTAGAGLVTFNGVEVDATDCTMGNVIFDNFLSTENLSIECTAGSANSANFMLRNVTCNKTLFLKSPNFTISGGLYKGSTEFYKYQTTGTIDQLFGGAGIVFESDLTLNNGSSKYCILGLNSTDSYTFKGNVTLKRLSTGEIRLARTGVCNFQANLDYQGDFATIPWGDSGGSCIFNGTTNQSITHNSSSTYPLLVTKLEVNKTNGKLTISNNVKVLKYGSTTGILTLRKGNVVTQINSTTPPYCTLTLSDDATIAGGGKHSYVEGPLTKEGNDAFKFFIGKGIKYFPVSISAPSATTASFTAEFFDDYQSSGNTTLTGTLKDAINCQYWKIDKAGTSAAVTTTLFWNNDLTQCCYPINHDIVCVAHYYTGFSGWTNEGSNVVNDYQPADSGYVSSTTSYTSMGYFALGYRNALVLNTYLTNPTKFKVYNNVEKMNLIYTSGASGSSADDKTMLSDAKNVAGNVVVHPSFSSTVDLNIDRQLSGTATDDKANYINYTPLFAKIYTTADGSANVVDHVTIDEDGDNTFLTLLSDVHEISGNTLSFYKQKQDPTLFELTNNLPDAITYTVNRYITTPYSSFQITSGVPAGYSATLNVYDINSTSVYTNNTDLSWNGKTDTTTFFPEGLYRYEVVLTNGTTTKSYKGQLILKHQ